MISVYVDASFRGRRSDASGLAALIICKGRIVGRAAITATATSSHHAECMAALLGLRLVSLIAADAHVKTVALHSDDQEVVRKLVKTDRQPRSDVLLSIVAELRQTVASLQSHGLKFEALYKSRFADQNMSHVDWMSKSVVNPQE